jgi:GAF domain-containing protein
MTETSVQPGSVAAAAQTDPLSAELLQSIVDVARAIFGAAASSMFLLDDVNQELVFQSVSGEGERSLVGRRFPADTGIAGWVVASGEAMVVDDLSSHGAFNRDFAESTEYVPNALMAAPLVHGERVLGVLEVLDPAPQSRSSINELDLLAMFARQAATALRVVVDRHPPGGRTRSTVLDAEGEAAARHLLAGLTRLLEPA